MPYQVTRVVLVVDEGPREAVVLPEVAHDAGVCRLARRGPHAEAEEVLQSRGHGAHHAEDDGRVDERQGGAGGVVRVGEDADEDGDQDAGDELYEAHCADRRGEAHEAEWERATETQTETHTSVLTARTSPVRNHLSLSLNSPCCLCMTSRNRVSIHCRSCVRRRNWAIKSPSSRRPRFLPSRALRRLDCGGRASSSP